MLFKTVNLKGTRAQPTYAKAVLHLGLVTRFKYLGAVGSDDGSKQNAL